MAPTPKQKVRCIQAMNYHEHSSILLTRVGIQCWKEGNVERAKVWLHRAIDHNKDDGDAWIAYGALLKKLGNTNAYEQLKQYVQRL
eukprot:CAMPEP_0117418674 /NCGR_PEP_ID=MMETSP0758-20121206/395_1 /TAXON_ID=63605 /ORGANISM="Percolomonas cosmopolitus, Strain AE-1 (ATCC 50343)" /LENGTH=85 /DNA_ID=CAMNT_0005199293 /DNA_START=378 /DNA_END=631 /DNA_ORIENTATION=-